MDVFASHRGNSMDSSFISLELTTFVFWLTPHLRERFSLPVIIDSSRHGLVVTALVVSTRLLYVDPG